MQSFSTTMNVANVAIGIPLNIQQVARTRIHVPSQAEQTRSLQLIQQWKIHIKSMKLSIHDAEESLLAGQKSLEESYEARLAVIRQEFVTAKSRMNDQSKAYIEPLRRRLAATERALLLEETFVASIRRIPDEILVRVFEWYLNGGFPTRQLALVCKAWKVLLLNTPSLWSNLTAFFVNPSTAVRQVPILQRRIELSRSTLLDVTLSTLSYDRLNRTTNRTDFFTLVAKMGTDRWRSLKVMHNRHWEDSFPTLELVLKGKFSSLHSIEFGILAEDDPFLPFYTILQDSNPPIREVICIGGVPQLLRGSSIFQRASRIATHEQFLGHFPPLGDLCELKLFSRATRHNLDGLQKNRLVHLELEGLSHFGLAIDLAFPELLSLSINNDDLSGMGNISAPKLARLKLQKYFSPLHKKKYYPKTLDSIRRELQSITLRPTMLHIDIRLSTKGLLILLKDWPQLMHLSLTFGEEFHWNGGFPRSLLRKSNPLCPRLVTLCLHSHSPNFGENIKQWEALALAILVARNNMPLKTIEWRHEGGPWDMLTFADKVPSLFG